MAPPTATVGSVAPLLMSVKDAASVCGVSRTKFYDLIAAGEIETVHIDKRHLVPYDSLTAYVERLRRRQGEGEVEVDG